LGAGGGGAVGACEPRQPDAHVIPPMIVKRGIRLADWPDEAVVRQLVPRTAGARLRADDALALERTDGGVRQTRCVRLALKDEASRPGRRDQLRADPVAKLALGERPSTARFLVHAVDRAVEEAAERFVDLGGLHL